MTRVKNVLAALGAVALASACQTDDPAAPARARTPPRTAVVANAPDGTPFQLQLMATLARRAALGQPVPSNVSFEYGPGSKAPQAAALRTAQASNQTTVAAKTVIHFESPAEAGYERWPDLVVTDHRRPGAEGFVREGDYSQVVRDKLAEQIPGIWQQYEFGYEPRTYTFNEQYTITSPDLGAPKGLMATSSVSTATALHDFLMGLTIPGPNLDYSIDWDYEVCVLGICGTVVDFFAGFKLDWGFGVRLPMDVNLTSSTPLSEGSSYFPTSVSAGSDWSAGQFTAAGVDAEDGNEFVMHFDFDFGVFLEVFGADVIDQGVRVHLDESQSFATPFGPGALFTLPSIDIPVWDFDASVASGAIGFSLTPHAGSDKFTAAWGASGEASGGGLLTYTDPAVSAPVGPVLAIDGPGVANIQLNDMRYYFNQFLLDLGIFFHLDVFSVVEETFTVPITDFDLSSFTGNLYVGSHSGTPSALIASIPIENVTPVVEIDRTGTQVINGIPTFMGQPGTFTGTAQDPGRDDLTLTWDWNDGAPLADISTTYPVPHVVSETQPHTFNGTCLYDVGFKAVDDDLASDEDHVPVVITGSATNRARLEGYWQHQFAQNGTTDFDAAALDCLLRVVGHLSAAFSEARDVSTIQNAYNVLFVSQNRGSAREQLDREMLVTWLNCANGAFGYMESMDTNADGIGDTPFASVLAAAEAVRMNGGATSAALKEQTRILHAISESGVGPVSMDGGRLRKSLPGSTSIP